MAGELSAAMDALATSLAAACPARIVSRDFVPLAQRSAAELEQGVVAVACIGETRFANYRGREAELGTLRVVVVAQVKVQEQSAPSALEDAEFTVAEEIKAWMQQPLAPPLRQCLATGFRQSGQMDHPYGWVAFECEVMT